METCWRITQNEKGLLNQIYKMFLYKESYKHISFVFKIWLDNDVNHIFLIKRDNKWSYLLTGTNIKHDKKFTILEITDLMRLN